MKYFPQNHILTTCNTENVENYYCRTDLFKYSYSFFPYVIVERNKLDINLCNAKSFLIFRNSILKIVRPMQNPIYNIHDPMGIKYLTRLLRLGLSHLDDHKFRNNFQDCINPLCPCSLEVESTVHYFLHCHYYDICKTFLDTVKKITNISISNLRDEYLANLLMHGNPSYNFQENVFEASIKFI